MADLGRMTMEELASKVLADEHGDWLREAVAFLACALMEAEVEGLCGASYRERSPERTNQRNGYRPRTLRTRVGEVELQNPEAAPRELLPEPPRALPGLRAGAGRLRPGGVRRRRLDAQGRPAGRGARAGRHVEGPGLAPLPGARRARAGLPGAPALGPLPVPLAGREGREGQGGRARP
jgi:hypothetical protein